MRRHLRRAHMAATAGWAAMIPVSALTGLRHSLPFLVAISVYALMVGHFAAYQATRGEDAASDD